ncbi:MAG: hypothetical protein ACI4BI_05985 [Anaerotardibacter sp.]
MVNALIDRKKMIKTIQNEVNGESEDANTPHFTPRYSLKKVTKPLNPTSEEKEEERTCPVRLINEDDDGYDPYSDYVEKPKFFEENPWD